MVDEKQYGALVERQWRRKPQVRGENLSQCHFVYHKSNWPGTEPETTERERPSTEGLKYGMTRNITTNRTAVSAYLELFQIIYKDLGAVFRLDIDFKYPRALY